MLLKKSEAPALRGTTQRLSLWLETRSAPVVATMAMLAGGIAFCLFWKMVVHGGPLRLSSAGDFWSLIRSATALLHGHFTAVYYKDSALTSPPAYEFVLAPFIGLGQLLGFSPHVRGGGQSLRLWLILGPVGILIGSIALFAVDAVARAWSFSERKRLALALVGGAAVANVAVTWGHPEDCVSLGLVLWSALLVERKGAAGFGAAAWMLGVAVAFQPLAILGVVPVMARFAGEWRSWVGLLWRLVVPSLVVLGGPLVAAYSHTVFVQLHQPFQPHYISYTPLTRWAPTIGPGLKDAGPTRLITIVLAVALSYGVCRKRHDLPTVLGVMTVAFFFRVLLESELNWYYFWPVVALSLLLALRLSWWRFAVSGVVVFASMALGNRRVHEIGWWWPGIVALAVVMVVVALPWGREAPKAEVPGGADGAGGAGGAGGAIESVGMDAGVGLVVDGE